MNEILKMLNALTADELDSVLMRGGIMLEKKRKEEAEAAAREKERQRLEKIEQEKKRLEEIAALQRKLQELQSQKVVIPDEPGKATGDNFVMYDERKPIDDAQAAEKEKASATIECPNCHTTNMAGRQRCWDCGWNLYQPATAVKTETPEMTACPHCKAMNIAGSQFCANCGQSMSKPQPSQTAKVSCPHCHALNDAGSVFCSNCGQKMTAKPPVAPPPKPVKLVQVTTAQVRYADESMKKWEMLPGEETKRKNHPITLLQPDGGKKFSYYMEVTNKRILLTREGNFSKNMGLAGALGGGLVGGLLMEGVKAAAGAGPKPWLEIPLAAISNCGLQGKKEFFIVADQTYVLKNSNYEILLPDLIANAKR